jgi:uracil-DNA glycosylase
MLRVDTFDAWRGAARELLARCVPPDEVSFTEGEQLGLLPAPPHQGEPGVPGPARVASLCVSAEFLAVARRVACHRDPSRWDRLYRVLWRAGRDGGRTLHDPSDPDVLALARMADAVRRDVERIRGLVRLRRVTLEGGEEWYVAFHRPLHRTLALAAPSFAERFAALRWSILTPDASAHWDRRRLEFGPGVPRDPGGRDDAEALWRTYYATTFNPARVNEKLLRAHLPRRHWGTLPEGSEIAALVRAARVQGAAGVAEEGAAQLLRSGLRSSASSSSDRAASDAPGAEPVAQPPPPPPPVSP